MIETLMKLTENNKMKKILFSYETRNREAFFESSDIVINLQYSTEFATFTTTCNSLSIQMFTAYHDFQLIPRFKQQSPFTLEWLTP